MEGVRNGFESEFFEAVKKEDFRRDFDGCWEEKLGYAFGVGNG